MPGVSARPTRAQDESDVRALYQALLAAWNERDAGGFSDCFASDGHTVGFDGSQLEGRAEIEQKLRRIFMDHPTASYVSKIRGIQFLSPDVALLRAVVGMVPAGQADLNPAVNAVQSMVAVRKPDQWRIHLFQNTPAAFHGSPEMSEHLTEELRQVLRDPGGADSK
jgi:uncharacterized protein (TIGR02246 family)